MQNIQLLSDSELAELDTLVGKERQRRRHEKERKLWDKVEEALHEYILEFGDIHIYIQKDDFHLTRRADFSTVGIIDEGEEE